MITTDDVLEFIHKRGSECTFAEFSLYMKGAKGGYDLTLPSLPNAIVWWRLDVDFIKALDRLREEGRIIYTRTDPEVYDIFKMRPPFPVVPKSGICIRKSWLPVVVELQVQRTGIITP